MSFVDNYNQTFLRPQRGPWDHSSWTLGHSQQTRGEAADWWFTMAMLLVAITGLAISGYLSWVSLTSSKIAGCGGALFDCNHVMGTKWSTILGVPVAIPAALLYLAMTTALIFKLISNRHSMQVYSDTFMVVAAITTASAAAWFIFLQLFVVQHLCAYCLAVHACGLVLAGLVMVSWNRLLVPARKFVAITAGVAPVLLVAGIQMASEPPPTYTIENTAPSTASNNAQESQGSVFEAPVSRPTVFQAPTVPTSDSQSGHLEASSSQLDLAAKTRLSIIALVSGRMGANLLLQQDSSRTDTTSDSTPDREKQPASRMVSVNGGQFQLNVDHWPVWGDKSAASIGVEMFDYTCPHCRATHHAIDNAMERSPNRLALIALAVPMNTSCNPAVPQTSPHHVTACDLAYLSIAVWRLAPDKFQQYHKWLFTGEHAPSVANARAKAESLVGAAALQKELQSGVPQQYVTKQCQLYQAVGRGIIPKIYFGSRVATGKITSTETILSLAD